MAAPVASVANDSMPRESSLPDYEDSKKIKLSDCAPNGDQILGHVQQSFKDFDIITILAENAETKTTVVHGKFNEDKEAVVILEKTPFRKDTLKALLCGDTSLALQFQNDIYGSYECHPPKNSNGIKTTIICPATDKHIQKYSEHQLFIVNETEEDFSTITTPYLEHQTFSMQWVYNILEKKSESERIVYEDPDPVNGFILLPDLKWDGKTVENLYLVAICHQHNIRSVRSLRKTHLPLLNNMLCQGKEAIKKKYGVNSNQLRVYVHYQPSYYHFHVHFTHLKYNAPGTGVTKSHLLSDIIDNIQLLDDYYKRKTLSFVVKESDGLYKAYKEAGKL